jgi:hypothetical protein
MSVNDQHTEGVYTPNPTNEGSPFKELYKTLASSNHITTPRQVYCLGCGCFPCMCSEICKSCGQMMDECWCNKWMDRD